MKIRNQTVFSSKFNQKLRPPPWFGPFSKTSDFVSQNCMTIRVVDSSYMLDLPGDEKIYNHGKGTGIGKEKTAFHNHFTYNISLLRRNNSLLLFAARWHRRNVLTRLVRRKRSYFSPSNCVTYKRDKNLYTIEIRQISLNFTAIVGNSDF